MMIFPFHPDDITSAIELPDQMRHTAMVSAQRIALATLNEYSIDVSIEDLKFFGMFKLSKPAPHGHPWVKFCSRCDSTFRWVVNYGDFLSEDNSGYKNFFRWAYSNARELPVKFHWEFPLEVLPKKFRLEDPHESFRKYYEEVLHKDSYTWNEGDRPQWLTK